MLTELRLRALLLGISAYLIAVISVSALSTLLAKEHSSVFEYQLFWVMYWLIGVLMLGIGGFVSGWVAGARGLLHGFIVGLLGALVVGGFLTLVFPSRTESETSNPAISYLLSSAVLTTLFGGIGELLKKRRTKGEL